MFGSFLRACWLA